MLNVTSDWGEVEVQVCDEAGEPIERMRSRPVRVDSVRAPVAWPEGNGLAAVAGRPVRLRFALSNALPYSWTIEPPRPEE